MALQAAPTLVKQRISKVGQWRLLSEFWQASAAFCESTGYHQSSGSLPLLTKQPLTDFAYAPLDHPSSIAGAAVCR